MKHFSLFTILLNILLASCIDHSSVSPSREPVYLVDVEGKPNEVTIQNQNQTTIIEVRSFTGIGHAKFRLESGDLPESLTTRLHLAGLEEFRLSSEHTIIAASFSSGSVFHNSDQKIILPDGERTIASNNPMWLDIRVVSSEPALQLPLDEGYFEIVFPKEFIKESGNSFEIQWIDFYR